MKRVISLFLVFLLASMMAVTAFAAETINTSDVYGNDKEDCSEEDIGIAPEHLLPFVYTEDDTFDFFRDLIGPNDCIQGCLYVKNFENGDIVQLAVDPVAGFTETAEYVYYVTEDQKIVKTDYAGQLADVIYQSTAGDIRSIEYYEGQLFFAEGNFVKQIDLDTGTAMTLMEGQQFLTVMPVSNDQLILNAANGDAINYNIATKQKIIMDTADLTYHYLSDLTNNGPMMLDEFPEVDTNAIEISQVSLPLPGYGRGVYFTTTGGPCDHEAAGGKDKCRTYASTNQCDGFAWFAHNQYNHLPGSTWSKPNKPAGDTNKTEVYFGSDTAMRNYFSNLTKGAFVRLNIASRPSSGAHSLVYVSAGSSKLTLYECNMDGKCGIYYGTRTYSEIRSYFPYSKYSVSHTYGNNAEQASDVYHKVICNNCAAFIYEKHYTSAPGTNATCDACGYVGSMLEGS